MPNKKAVMQKQCELQSSIQDAGFNIVTCGNCGQVFLHELTDTVLECPHCDALLDCCDCPDLFWEGWSSGNYKTSSKEVNKDAKKEN